MEKHHGLKFNKHYLISSFNTSNEQAMNVFWFINYLFIAFGCNATIVESFWLSACDRKRLEVGRALTVISTQLLKWGFKEAAFHEPPRMCWQEIIPTGHKRIFFRLMDSSQTLFRLSIQGILYDFSFAISYPANVYWRSQPFDFTDRRIIQNRYEWFQEILEWFAYERPIDKSILSITEIPESIEAELDEYL
jgi:hypothetical protein